MNAKDLSILRISPLSFLPNIGMMFFHMLPIIFEKFKIFYSIVCSDVIDMMDSFFQFKFSSKIFLHNIAVLEHSFTIYIHTKITKVIEMRFSFFKICPIWRDIITLMSKPPTSVNLTNLPIIPFKNIFTVFNFTNFTKHNIIIA